MYYLQKICFVQCSSFFIQDPSFIDIQTGLLKSLLTTGAAVYYGINYGMASLILPIANLSVVEAYKGRK
jgi:hypothetical protein